MQNSIPQRLVPKNPWVYTFSRGDNVTWRTGIGQMLLLFLETYITFDYQNFGISIEHDGYVGMPIGLLEGVLFTLDAVQT